MSGCVRHKCISALLRTRGLIVRFLVPMEAFGPQELPWDRPAHPSSCMPNFPFPLPRPAPLLIYLAGCEEGLKELIFKDLTHEWQIFHNFTGTETRAVQPWPFLNMGLPLLPRVEVS